MPSLPRASIILLAGLLAACNPGASPTAATRPGSALPMTTRFRGDATFHALQQRALAENWAALPIGPRTLKVATALLGTPYQNWTLEIDDLLEAPSVNFTGLDCWTGYEIPLAFARMISGKPAPWSKENLLYWIEQERYRNGHCDGSYLSRMHYLEEVFYDNQRRGLAVNITQSLPGAAPLHRQITDMSGGWPQYRYLRANPDLVAGITAMEQRVSNLPVWYIPKDKVARIESLLQPGDIIAITGASPHSYTTHVGMAAPQPDGTARFLHATSDFAKGRKTILDRRISDYLGDSTSHTGIIVCRPR